MSITPAPPTAQPVVPAASTEPPLKPGYATTEFWLAISTQVFFLLSFFNVGNVDTTNPRVEGWIHVAAAVLAAVGTGFYAIARGHAKRGAAVAQGLAALAENLLGGTQNIAQGLADAKSDTMGTQDFTALNAELVAVNPAFSEDQLDQLEERIAPLIQDVIVNNVASLVQGQTPAAPDVPVDTGNEAVTSTPAQVEASQPDKADDTFVAPSF